MDEVSDSAKQMSLANKNGNSDSVPGKRVSSVRFNVFFVKFFQMWFL